MIVQLIWFPSKALNGWVESTEMSFSFLRHEIRLERKKKSTALQFPTEIEFEPSIEREGSFRGKKIFYTWGGNGTDYFFQSQMYVQSRTGP